MKIVEAKILNIYTGEFLEERVLEIENGYIKKIGNRSEYNVESEDVRILKGKYIIPGLINAHTHASFTCIDDKNAFNNKSEAELFIDMTKNLEIYLSLGFTTIRELGCMHDFSLLAKKLEIEDKIVSPQIYTSHKYITCTGGHGNFFGEKVDSIEGYKKTIRDFVNKGVDVIKLMVSGGFMTPNTDVNRSILLKEEIEEAVRIAHYYGKPVSVHTHPSHSIKLSLESGVDIIEHGTFINDECINLMIKNNKYLVPTLVATHALSNKSEKFEKIHNKHRDSFLQSYKAGVKIAVGTDSGTLCNYHDNSINELILMSHYGMSNIDVIKAATLYGAEVLGAKDIGNIEAGMRADLVILDDNPLDDISNIKKISEVYKKGKVVYKKI